MRLINSDGQVVDAKVIAKDGGNAASASIGAGVFKWPLIIVLCVLAGMSLMGTAWAIHEAQQARMEARILQVKVEGFENALWAQKIDPTPHLKGQHE